MCDSFHVQARDRHENRSERGQSLVMVVLLMFGMVAFLGLVIDGGGVFLERRRSQDAADGAAYAGARVLALRPDDSATSELAVWNSIVTYASANGVTSASDVSAFFMDENGNNICRINQDCGGVPTSPLATGVRVDATRHWQPYFMSLMVGRQPIPVSAVAAVQSGPPMGKSDLMPMTIKFPCPDPLTQECFKADGETVYQLFGDPQAGGNFQWTNYSNPCQTNTTDLVDYLNGTKEGGMVWADPDHLFMDPSSPAWICGYTGVNTAEKVKQALDWWLAQPEDQRHWIIPVTDLMNGSGSNVKYHVIMFADFVPTGYDFGNNQNNPSTFRCSSPVSPTATAGPSPTSEHGRPPTATPEPKKCIEGKFFKKVDNLEIAPGKCNFNGADICGMGISQ